LRVLFFKVNHLLSSSFIRLLGFYQKVDKFHYLFYGSTFKLNREEGYFQLVLLSWSKTFFLKTQKDFFPYEKTARQKDVKEKNDLQSKLESLWTTIFYLIWFEWNDANAIWISLHFLGQKRKPFQFFSMLTNKHFCHPCRERRF